MTREVPILPINLELLISIETTEHQWRLPDRITEQVARELTEVYPLYKTAIQPVTVQEIEDALAVLALHYLGGERTLDDFNRLIDDFIVPLSGVCLQALQVGVQNWRENNTRWPTIPELRNLVDARQEYLVRTFLRLQFLHHCLINYAGEVPRVTDADGNGTPVDSIDIAIILEGKDRLKNRRVEWPVIEGAFH